jgi:hypothetical protein
MTKTTADAQHDSECEIRPGGQYDGVTINGFQVPCHCPARKAGRDQADRQMRREHSVKS